MRSTLRPRKRLRGRDAFAAMQDAQASGAGAHARRPHDRRRLRSPGRGDRAQGGRDRGGDGRLSGGTEDADLLDFEKPIADLEGKIAELRHLSSTTDLNIAEEVGRLQSKLEGF